MNLPHDVEQVLIGSLLGDGGIYFPKEGQNAYFVEGHGDAQLSYLRWKATILAKYFGGRIDKGGGRFRTRVSPLLTDFRHRWYPNGKKIVPEIDLKKLDALGIAVWYQDDGCYDFMTRRCSLSIHGFNGQESALKQWFDKKLRLNSHSRTPNLYFSVKDSDKFLHLIAEHIHPSMIYKLGHLSPANRSRIEEARENYLRRRNKMIKQQHKYYINHRDRIRKQQQEYYLKNREKILTYRALKKKPKEVA